MEILNTTTEDFEFIFWLYDQATTYQKQVTDKHWMGFEKSRVTLEITEKRHWKIIEGNDIVCTFVTTFNDPDIWQKRDADPAVYIHRIATNPNFRGNGYVKKIVQWVKEYAKSTGKRFVRMDTHSGNDRLNAHYIGCGFVYLGVTELHNVENLPMHYQQSPFYSLFEIDLERSVPVTGAK